MFADIIGETGFAKIGTFYPQVGGDYPIAYTSAPTTVTSEEKDGRRWIVQEQDIFIDAGQFQTPPELIDLMKDPTGIQWLLSRISDYTTEGGFYAIKLRREFLDTRARRNL